VGKLGRADIANRVGLVPYAINWDDWQYLFKCDDDTYVAVARLLAYDIAGRDYIGGDWTRGVGFASGGGGYFRSRRAAEVVAENLDEETGPEDALMRDKLRSTGIELCLDR